MTFRISIGTDKNHSKISKRYKKILGNMFQSEFRRVCESKIVHYCWQAGDFRLKIHMWNCTDNFSDFSLAVQGFCFHSWHFLSPYCWSGRFGIMLFHQFSDFQLGKGSIFDAVYHRVECIGYQLYLLICKYSFLSD